MAGFPRLNLAQPWAAPSSGSEWADNLPRAQKNVRGRFIHPDDVEAWTTWTQQNHPYAFTESGDSYPLTQAIQPWRTEILPANPWQTFVQPNRAPSTSLQDLLMWWRNR